MKEGYYNRNLSKMKEKESMSLVNADIHICKRLWTREQRKVKSVIDCVMNNTEYLRSI